MQVGKIRGIRMLGLVIYLNNKVVNFKTLNGNEDERKDGDDDDNDKTERVAPVSPAALTRWL